MHDALFHHIFEIGCIGWICPDKASTIGCLDSIFHGQGEYINHLRSIVPCNMSTYDEVGCIVDDDLIGSMFFSNLTPLYLDLNENYLRGQIFGPFYFIQEIFQSSHMINYCIYPKICQLLFIPKKESGKAL